MSDPFVDDSQTLDITGDAENQQEETSSEPNYADLFAKQEAETKKFQSLYDKSQAESQKRFDALEGLLGNITQNLSGLGQQQNQDNLDIDPFEVFTPETKSNKYFQEQVQKTASQIVDERLGAMQRQMQEQQVVSNIQNMLQQKGFTPEQTSGFMDFLQGDINPEMLPVLAESYIKYKQGSPSLEDVRQTQEIPSMAGASESALPPQPSDEEKLWKGITSADVGSKIF